MLLCFKDKGEDRHADAPISLVISIRVKQIMQQSELYEKMARDDAGSHSSANIRIGRKSRPQITGTTDVSRPHLP